MAEHYENEKRVLDKGFVRLVEMLGNDFSPVQAARVSTGKGLTSPERDTRLLLYLMENGHHSPFEHIVFKFHIKLPIFVMRQLVRHRIASINERSGRYSEFDDDWYLPDHARVNEKGNIQGSVFSGDEQLDEKTRSMIETSISESYETYRKLLEMGVARELARIVLPSAMYTEFYWTINARSLMNFLSLRADSHAQYEIQECALAIADIFKETCPTTFEAFIRYHYSGDIIERGDKNDT